MDVSLWVWLVTVAVILAMLAVDFVGHARVPHAPSMRESATWSAAYVAVALVFGGLVWVGWGGEYAGEYFAGYVTEKSLSIDNLFVFVLIMATFRVPRVVQQKVLLFGITVALVLRTVFILLGAALIENFSWVFYVFGAFLLWTAWSQVRHARAGDEEEFHENGVLRLARRVLPVTDDFVDDKMVVRRAGRRLVTPLLFVMIAIGSADVLFAVDSIPAIFGLTQETYLVFAANAFSLLGLRQLYFLVDGLLDRLVFLAYGLAAILGFIGVKLVLHALHTNELPFVNGGEHVDVPEVSTALSLGYIAVVLTVTTVLSLWVDARRQRAAAAATPPAEAPTDARKDA
ncbi:TerC family protein [Luteimicrobium subarcticum]|uniref:Tellurite resistance protein TerC n=1 Tax=Luteimicrobium subarcticum TaxID=620910 RepID=A0A2M8W3F1_9MICO|nr:TerC family protein [Luteimicrobium subarcticum]PJI85444.1 tellurite resistance protein TerC [Luteimicrobium subarcticum]